MTHQPINKEKYEQLNLDLTGRMPLSQLYAIDIARGYPALAKRSEASVLGKAGVYLIYDKRFQVVSADPNQTLIYVGLAGAVGLDSTFDARVSKHVYKALGFHSEHPDQPQSGISDTVLWKSYRDTHLTGSLPEDVETLQGSWEMEFIVLPNATEAERLVITLMEKVVALIYSVSKLDPSQSLVQPLCNGTDLIKPLLKLLTQTGKKTRRPRPKSHVIAMANLVGQSVKRDATENLNLPLTLLNLDTENMDPQFFARMSLNAQQTYADYLTAVTTTFGTVTLAPHTPYIHYTNTDGRDLRIGGIGFSSPQKKNCMTAIWQPQLEVFRFRTMVSIDRVEALARNHGVQVTSTAINDPLPTQTVMRIEQQSGDVVSFWVALSEAAILVA